MNEPNDHYSFLGLPMNASEQAIAAALDRRSRQAEALQASSPGQATAIRDRVRQIRQDLLIDPQRRQAYDRWLLASGAGRDDTIVAPLASPPEQPRYTAVPPPRPAYSTSYAAQPAGGGSNARWIIPLVIVAALLVGAGAALAATKIFGGGPFAAASPTATARPTATIPAPTATVAPTARPTRVPTAAPTSAPTSGPTTVPVDPLSHARTVIKDNGYDPAPNHAQTSDGSGGTLYAWAGTCSGSADGHCQKVFFFDGTRYLGTDTSASSLQINSVVATAPATIAVTYANFRPSDPLCCPTGPPITITYFWNGSRLIPSGTPPGH